MNVGFSMIVKEIIYYFTILFSPVLVKLKNNNPYFFRFARSYCSGHCCAS